MDSFLADNCTIVVPFTVLGLSVWVTIPCDRTVNAAYVCQNYIRRSEIYNPAPITETCEQGWFLLKGTGKCYIALKATFNISYRHASDECKSRDSAILSMTVYNHGYPQETDRRLRLTLAHLKPSESSGFFTANRHNLTSSVFGQPLLQNVAHNKIAIILLHHVFISIVKQGGKKSFPPHIDIFANFSTQCGIIQYIHNGWHLLQKFTMFLQGWGAKYRSCYENYKVDILVCEKKSQLYIITCQTGHYQCKDHTCILVIYKCDKENDCFDGSDEINCDFTSEMVSGDLLSFNVPCQLSHNCSQAESVLTLFIHSICDGIYNNMVLVDEILFCKENNLPKGYIGSMQVHESNSTASYSTSIISNLLKTEIKHMKELHTKQDIPQIHASKNNMNAEIYNSIDIVNICHTNVRSISNTFADKLRICHPILCPGMFKCKAFHCIRLATLCNGQQDCLYGEDETLCDQLVCPGALKCRGENRCVGAENLCDGNTDCLYTFDDEVWCPNCPVGCTCEGYVVFCKDVIFLENMGKSDSTLFYFRSILIEISIGTLNLNNFPLHHILYIDVSSCSLNSMIAGQSDTSPDIYRLLIADFSKNKLKSLTFLSHHLFKFLHIVDLSNNLFTDVTADSLKIVHLVIIKLNGNPIKSIFIKISIAAMRLVQLRQVPFHGDLSIFVHDQCWVFVTNPLICCILPTTNKCISESNNAVACFGLLKYIQKIAFGAILCLVLIIFCFCLVMTYRLKLFSQRKKRYNFIALLNVEICNVMLVLYFVSLEFADIMGVNVVIFRKSTICVILSVTLFTTIHSSLALKTLSLFIVATKILYPFKHECRWLRYSYIVCFTIWVVVGCPYIVRSVVQYDLSDTFCTSFDCHRNTTGLVFFRVILDVMCMTVCILSEAQAMWSLHQNNKLKKKNNLTNLNPVCFIGFKLGRAIYPEFAFRKLLFSFYVCNYFKLCRQFCEAIVLFVIPINVMISFVCYIL